MQSKWLMASSCMANWSHYSRQGGHATHNGFGVVEIIIVETPETMPQLSGVSTLIWYHVIIYIVSLKICLKIS